MPPLARSGARRLLPVVMAGVLAVSSLLAWAPASGTRALDPTPDPVLPGEPSPAPTPAPDPTPVPDPTPGPEPTPTPLPDPTATPDPTPVPDPTATPTVPPEPTPTVAPTPDPTPTPGPAEGVLEVAHTWIDGPGADGRPAPGAMDAARTRLERYTVYRVRFQVANTGGTVLRFTPVLQVARGAAPGAFTAVPAVDPALDQPFYAAPRKDGAVVVGTRPIAAADLRLATGPGGSMTPVAGTASDGVNPIAAITLRPGEYTEVEFAVRATNWARWQATYTFRLADAAGALAPAPGAERAMVTLRAKPPVKLSPGQRSGTLVEEPLPLYPLTRPKAATADIAGAEGTAGIEPSALEPAGSVRLLAGAGEESPHQASDLASDSCAACHSAHQGQSTFIRTEPAPLANQCFLCHDGSGTASDIRAEFENPGLPPNDPATGSWYSHPALVDGDHVTDREDEFGGVSNRHATCADCHQPHRANAALPEQTTGGWTVSGAIEGASGVAVVNGAAGTEPAYTWVRSSQLEYQLCFKCHSGWTELPARDPAHPSRWALDKAVELNPANLSYHPVEAAGTNQTSEMAASLAGSSPYKLWTFRTDSTVRCLNCHGDGSQLTAGTPPEARLSNHTSRNRGILLANYRDRSLLGSTELYDAGDFALCYLCHGEAPMVDDSGDPRADTGFNWHGLHTLSILGIGTVTGDIDTDGAGRGNAVCAECHFRIHGTTDAVDGQPQTPRLVNFAPNVQPNDGVLEFAPAGNATFGTCTLTCHGQPHDGYLYD